MLVIGEIGINHNGDIEIAKRLIDLAKQNDLDFVKFQKREIGLVYTKEGLDKPRESPWGITNREQKEGLEFNRQEYYEIDKHCILKDIDWFGSPWDIVSVEFLSTFDVPYMKIASAMVTDSELLEAVKNTNIPVIISTGMSTKEEIDKALDILGDNVEYILACTSSYPTPDNEVNLRFIKTLKQQYPNYKIGFSNHSPGIKAMEIAAVLGAEMLEFHMTLDRSMYGSDQAASIESTGVELLMKFVKNLPILMGSKDWVVTPKEEEIKKKLRKTQGEDGCSACRNTRFSYDCE